MTDLLFKHFRGTTTPQEEDQLKEWMESCPEINSKIYKEACFLYEAGVLYGDDQNLKVKKPITSRRIFSYIGAAAAAVAIFFGVSKYTGHRTLNRIAQQYTTTQTAPGHQVDLTLPDGSVVKLNSDTKLEYPPIFSGKERRVKLDGEALFEVARNEKSPFIVETFASEVEVLGTKFNVLADEQKARFETTLINGSVKVTNISDPNNNLIMKPGQTVLYENGNLSLQKADTDALCWTAGQVSFKGLNFVELMAAFEKAFGVNIVVADDNLPDADYSYGKVRVADGIDHAMHVLQQSLDFNYTMDEATNTITITE